jgi:hypothetical protein
VHSPVVKQNDKHGSYSLVQVVVSSLVSSVRSLSRWGGLAVQLASQVIASEVADWGSTL